MTDIQIIVSVLQRQTELLEAIDKRLAARYPYADEPGGENERREARHRWRERYHQKLQEEKAAAVQGSASEMTSSAST